MNKASVVRVIICFVSATILPGRTSAQAVGTEQDWEVRTPAVSGYEQKLADQIREGLKGLSPHTDNLGNVYVTLGSGSPLRLIATPMDEPGYVVRDRKSTRLNSSHSQISYAVFCLKKNKSVSMLDALSL